MTNQVDQIVNNAGPTPSDNLFEVVQDWTKFGFGQVYEAIADQFLWFEMACVLIAIGAFVAARSNWFRPFLPGKLSKENSRINRRWGSPEPAAAGLRGEYKRSNSRSPPPNSDAASTTVPIDLTTYTKGGSRSGSGGIGGRNSQSSSSIHRRDIPDGVRIPAPMSPRERPISPRGSDGPMTPRTPMSPRGPMSPVSQHGTPTTVTDWAQLGSLRRIGSASSVRSGFTHGQPTMSPGHRSTYSLSQYPSQGGAGTMSPSRMSSVMSPMSRNPMSPISVRSFKTQDWPVDTINEDGTRARTPPRTPPRNSFCFNPMSPGSTRSTPAGTPQRMRTRPFSMPPSDASDNAEDTPESHDQTTLWNQFLTACTNDDIARVTQIWTCIKNGHAFEEFPAVVKKGESLPVSKLKAVTRRLLGQLDEEDAVKEIVAYVEKMNTVTETKLSGKSYSDAAIRSLLTTVVPVKPVCGKMFLKAFSESSVDHQDMLETILCAQAAVAATDSVLPLFSEKFADMPEKTVTAVINAALGKSHLECALVLAQHVMKQKNGEFPTAVVENFWRVAVARADVQRLVQAEVPLQPEALHMVFQHFLTQRDCAKMQKFEQRAKDQNIEFVYGSYDCLLKAYANAGDNVNAQRVFDELQKSSFRISEGTCVGVLVHCAESRDLKTAELVIEHAKENNLMSVCTYSALMKVYANAGMIEKACDLYDDMVEDGLEPDAPMFEKIIKNNFQNIF